MYFSMEFEVYFMNLAYHMYPEMALSENHVTMYDRCSFLSEILV